jgi:hypothetical protein
MVNDDCYDARQEGRMRKDGEAIQERHEACVFGRRTAWRLVLSQFWHMTRILLHNRVRIITKFAEWFAVKNFIVCRELLCTKSAAGCFCLEDDPAWVCSGSVLFGIFQPTTDTRLKRAAKPDPQYDVTPYTSRGDRVYWCDSWYVTWEPAPGIKSLYRTHTFTRGTNWLASSVTYHRLQLWVLSRHGASKYHIAKPSLQARYTITLKAH